MNNSTKTNQNHSKSDETWNQVQGAWEQVKGSIKKTWGKMTDDDIAECKGSREQMIGKIMQRHGVDRADAESQVSQWQSSYSPSNPTPRR